MCLGFVHIPDIGPIPFKIIEQKKCQRCETHIDVQSCKASYVDEAKSDLVRKFEVLEVLRIVGDKSTNSMKKDRRFELIRISCDQLLV